MDVQRCGKAAAASRAVGCIGEQSRALSLSRRSPFSSISLSLLLLSVSFSPLSSLFFFLGLWLSFPLLSLSLVFTLDLSCASPALNAADCVALILGIVPTDDAVITRDSAPIRDGDTVTQ